MKVLVTGGAGYIGSHICVQLLEAGHELVVLDNLSNSNEEALIRVKELAGRDFTFYQISLQDRNAVERVFQKNELDAVVHLAGSKAVGESVSFPLDYYRNNVAGTLVLCEAMSRAGVRRLVFSSSATVYGKPDKCPIHEQSPLRANNPYGRSKLMIEDILHDLHASDPRWSIAVLRYFNPIGAHRSGLIGEDPKGEPNNLLPYITQVAIGQRDKLIIFGNDYPTPDGTGIRDYIHVEDLACGHLKALEKLGRQTGIAAYNLGTGKGYSVLDIVRVFERATGRHIPLQFADRRPGDVAESYAYPGKAKLELDWAAIRGIEEMCADAWRWQSLNPYGYLDVHRSYANTL
ncbi:UDP-glucose 4-epimerase [Paenibacillus glycanilyticus]|uniref:UDP-glucose 4-epimerase n=1 Tax=Paenibacillus glycanilyticus TaxID=126569 RepID=A0ABQ6NNM1_9BACL|nr:UDP-glucose 4-epimerase GalE [Paenibacillus glycanilyticus]GMK46700.1 UDP-glucose 4-epimerase [Paenibacillus glycanilyticus]